MDSFELEDTDDCQYDKLTLHDGGHLSSPTLGQFCGTMNIPAFNSTGRLLLVTFETDLAFQFSGFKLDYSIS